MDLGLRGKAAFVAAASRGMGRATAILLAQEGADVGICARTPGPLEEAARELRGYGVRAEAVIADVSNTRDCASAVEHVAQALGRLDILVVNAGGPPPGAFTAIDAAQWENAFALTLMSAVTLVSAALPWLARSEAGSIVFISSWAVRQPIPSLTLSNSFRSALAGLAKSLANELAPRVRVNTVLPGSIRTERQVDLATRAGVTDLASHFEAMARDIPLGRIGEADEVARALAFLCSPAASYITGEMLAVDGGVIRSIS